MTAPVSQVLSEADIALIVNNDRVDTSIMERLFRERDYGVAIVNVGDEASLFDSLTQVERLNDLRDFVRSPWLNDRRRSAGPAFNVLRGDVEHIVTPDPISKRKARRPRGRAAALAKEQNK